VSTLSVLARDIVKQKLRFAAHRLRKILVEIWKLVRIGKNLVEVLEAQPLHGEIGGQALRSPVG
jgi:hypothetical protein